MARVRDIEITSFETALGWPVACTDAGDTTVYVRQAPAGTGLLIEICTKTAADHDTLTVTLDGQPLYPPRPPAGSPPDIPPPPCGRLAPAAAMARANHSPYV